MQARDLILAIDQGTHASRTVLFDINGHAVFKETCPIGLNRLDKVRVEQNPNEIVQATRKVVRAALAHARDRQDRIVSAGISTQRSTVLAWDARSGKALTPALSWQDTRARSLLRDKRQNSLDLSERTGLYASPHFGASKLQWLLRENSAVRAAARTGHLRMGPLSAFLLNKLIADDTNKVDHANASRTLLFNINDRDWDSSLLDAFGLDARMLPECRPCQFNYGMLNQTRIPVACVMGDQGAAVFGSGTDSEELLINLGTGAFVLSPLMSRPLRSEQLLCTLVSSERNSTTFSLEGTINGCGAAINWVKQQFGLEAEHKDFRWPSPNSPVFLNSVGGLGSPWWRDGLEPRFVELDPGKEPSLDNVYESILFLVKTNIDAIVARVKPVSRIKIAGGVSELPGLAQALADLSGYTVEINHEPESTALGLAWLLAGKPQAWFKNQENRRFSPNKNTLADNRYEQFLSLIEREL